MSGPGTGPGDDADGSAEEPHRPGPAVGVDPDADGRTAFLQALRVRRNAGVGVAVGVTVTVAVFVLFVVVPGTVRSPLWYVGLAFVLATSTAALVAALLTLARAVRLSRHL